jgi:adenine-specific DNA methylase
MHGLFLEKFNQLYGNNPVYCTAACLSVGSAINYLARLCGVNPHFSKGPGSTRNVFFNQALNPQYLYGSRAFQELENFYKRSLSSSSNIECSDATIECQDARENSQICDLWITDPPYADAVHYHELSEFFLSWYEGNFSQAFPNWHKSVRVALAVRGNGEDFKRSMVEIYSNLTNNMTDEGMQLVMFTHQDPSVWADLGMILWAAGLQVSAAWTISTETDSSLKKGNYVQGTVLLVLRKRLNADERLYLKGVELEKHGELRNGAYQELAKGFGVRDYNFLYAKTKPNEARFKTASEFKRTNLKGDGFDRTLVRHLLFAIHETVSKETVQEGLNYLKVEVPNYWSERKRSLEILRYLSRLQYIPHLPHWKKDAEAARVLAGAVENDHG